MSIVVQGQSGSCITTAGWGCPALRRIRCPGGVLVLPIIQLISLDLPIEQQRVSLDLPIVRKFSLDLPIC